MQRVWSVIESVLRRRPWVVVLLVLVPCAYFDAAGFNQLLAANLFQTDVTALTRASAAATPNAADAGASHHVRNPDRILSRNVFDSEAGCLNCAAPDAAEPEGPVDPAAPPDVRPAEPCTGQIRVTGGVIVSAPMWSFAFAVAQANQPAQPYRWGMQLDNKRVIRIFQDDNPDWAQNRGVVVELQGASGPACYYAQRMPPRPATPPPPPPQAGPTVAAGPDGLDPQISAGIERSGNNEYAIRRAAIDRILERQADFMRNTRIMPVEEGGRVTGVQLFGVAPTNLLGRLGMQNGDVLRTINGLDISAPDRALEAYTRLRTADRISVQLTRNGQPVNIDFNIRQ